MKKFYLIFSLFILLIFSGCTQYNGHIGPIFGSWAVVDISENGAPLELKEETVFSFQNEVVRVEKVSANPDKRSTKYGNFILSDNELSLNFLQAVLPDGEGAGYLVPSWLYFPKNMMPLRFDVKTLNGSKMILVLHDGSNDLTYTFDRTW